MERRNIYGLHKKKHHKNTLVFELQVLGFFHMYATDDQGIKKKKKKK